MEEFEPKKPQQKTPVAPIAHSMVFGMLLLITLPFYNAAFPREEVTHPDVAGARTQVAEQLSTPHPSTSPTPTMYVWE